MKIINSIHVDETGNLTCEVASLCSTDEQTMSERSAESPRSAGHAKYFVVVSCYGADAAHKIASELRTSMMNDDVEVFAKDTGA